MHCTVNSGYNQITLESIKLQQSNICVLIVKGLTAVIVKCYESCCNAFYWRNREVIDPVCINIKDNKIYVLLANLL